MSRQVVRFFRLKVFALFAPLSLQALQCKTRSYETSLADSDFGTGKDSCEDAVHKFQIMQANGTPSLKFPNTDSRWKAHFSLAQGLQVTEEGAFQSIAPNEFVEFGFEVEFYPHVNYNPDIVCFYSPVEKTLMSVWQSLDKRQRLDAAQDYINMIRNKPASFKKMSFSLIDSKNARVLPQILTQESTGKIEADLGSGPQLEPFAVQLKFLEDLFGAFQVQGHLTLPLNESWQKIVPLGYADFVLAESDAALVKILAKEFAVYNKSLLQNQSGQRARLPAGHFLSQTLRPVNEHLLAALRNITMRNDQGSLLRKFSPDLFLLKFFAAPVLRDSATYKSSYEDGNGFAGARNRFDRGGNRFGIEFRQFDFPSVGEPPLPGFYVDLLNALARAASQLVQTGRFNAQYSASEIPPASNSTLSDFSSAALEIITDPSPESLGVFGLDENSADFHRAVKALNSISSAQGAVSLRNFRNLIQIAWVEAQGNESNSRIAYEVSQAVLFPLRNWHRLLRKSERSEIKRSLWPAALRYFSWLVSACDAASRSPENVNESLIQMRIELAKWAHDSRLAERFQNEF